MAVEDRSLSEFPRALQVAEQALFMISNPDGLGGYDTNGAVLTEVGKALLNVQYTQQLGNVSVFDAIKNTRVLSGTTTPLANEGANGQLYVKYETVSNVDNVVGMYFKKDGAWLEISLGGGGGADYVECTQAEYDAWEQAGTLDPTVMYFITDGQSGGGSGIHDMTYTGTGTSTNAITFPSKPSVILSIDGEGLSNNYAHMGAFRYGETFVPIVYYDGNQGGTLYNDLTYSNNDLTLTISGYDAGAVCNASGKTYHVLWM